MHLLANCYRQVVAMWKRCHEIKNVHSAAVAVVDVCGWKRRLVLVSTSTALMKLLILAQKKLQLLAHSVA
jgi:hypothetical protein